MAMLPPASSGFTKPDLTLLRSMWPHGTYHHGPHADVFAISERDNGEGWVVISRRRDGSYVMIDSSGRHSTERRFLSALLAVEVQRRINAQWNRSPAASRHPVSHPSPRRGTSTTLPTAGFTGSRLTESDRASLLDGWPGGEIIEARSSVGVRFESFMARSETGELEFVIWRSAGGAYMRQDARTSRAVKGATLVQVMPEAVEVTSHI